MRSKNKLLVCVLLLGFGAAGVIGVVALRGPDRGTVEVSGIRVVGSGQFRARTVAALDLLRTADPAAYREVCAVLTSVEEGDRSGVEVELGRVQIAPATFDGGSREWYASVLAHEAHHARLYRDEGRHRTGEAVFEAERLCNELQLGVLRRVGGRAYEVQWLQSQNHGRHPDVNGDGTYGWDDYYARKW